MSGAMADYGKRLPEEATKTRELQEKFEAILRDHKAEIVKRKLSVGEVAFEFAKRDHTLQECLVHAEKEDRKLKKTTHQLEQYKDLVDSQQVIINSQSVAIEGLKGKLAELGLEVPE